MLEMLIISIILSWLNNLALSTCIHVDLRYACRNIVWICGLVIIPNVASGTVPGQHIAMIITDVAYAAEGKTMFQWGSSLRVIYFVLPQALFRVSQ